LSDYRFGQVKVEGELFSRDLIVFGEEVLCPWVRQHGHRLLPDDLGWIAARAPRLLIVGSGTQGRLLVPESTMAWAATRGILLVVRRTVEAIGEFNDQVARGSGVGACLHLTC